MVPEASNRLDHSLPSPAQFQCLDQKCWDIIGPSSLGQLRKHRFKDQQIPEEQHKESTEAQRQCIVERSVVTPQLWPVGSTPRFAKAFFVATERLCRGLRFT